MIVAVALLCSAAGADEVDLCRHLVAGAEPGFGHRIERRGGVVAGEGLGIGEAELLQAVPDPGIGAGLGEVIAAAAALFGDDPVEHPGGRVDGIGVDRALEHQRPGEIAEHMRPFGHDSLAGRGIGKHRRERGHIVDGHVLFHDIGVAQGRGLELAGTKTGEFLDPAIGFGVVAHGPSFPGLRSRTGHNVTDRVVAGPRFTGRCRGPVNDGRGPGATGR